MASLTPADDASYAGESAAASAGEMMVSSHKDARPGRAAEKLLTTPGMRQIPVNYRPDSEPEAQTKARRREAGAGAYPEAPVRRVSAALRGFLIVAGAVVIVAAGVAIGVYLMA